MLRGLPPMMKNVLDQIKTGFRGFQIRYLDPGKTIRDKLAITLQ